MNISTICGCCEKKKIFLKIHFLEGVRFEAEFLVFYHKYGRLEFP